MSGDDPTASESPALAAMVRDACIDRLRHEYEQAAIQGLCGEGAFEYALDRLRHLPAEQLLTAKRPDSSPPPDQGTDP